MEEIVKFKAKQMEDFTEDKTTNNDVDYMLKWNEIKEEEVDEIELQFFDEDDREIVDRRLLKKENDCETQGDVTRSGVPQCNQNSPTDDNLSGGMQGKNFNKNPTDNSELKKRQTPVVQCPLCDFAALNFPQLKSHVDSRHSSLSLMCEICTFTSADRNQLRAHMRKKHVKCSVCNFITTEEALTEHMVQKHQANLKTEFGENGFLSKKPKTFPSIPLEKETHIEKVKTQLICCMFCNFVACNLIELKIHNAQHHVKLPHMCTLCTFMSPNKEELHAHMDMKHTQCPVCSYVATEEACLDHLLQNHQQNFLGIMCELCGFKAASKNDFLQHVVTSHGDENNQMSTQCDSDSLKIKTNLPDWNKDPLTIQYNVTGHNEDKTTNNSLSGRIKQPGGIGQFFSTALSIKCQLCPFRAANQQLINKHMRSEHKQFPCPECQFVGTVFSDLRSHISSKHKKMIVNDT